MKNNKRKKNLDAATVIAIMETAPKKTVRPSELLRELGLTKKDSLELKSVIQQLLDEGKLFLTSDGGLRLHASPKSLVGRVRKGSRGGGIFLPNNKPDEIVTTPLKADSGEPVIAIAAEDMRDAFNGDTVEVELLSRRGAEGKRFAKVVAIVQRARNDFVGTYFEQSGQGWVRLDSVAAEPVQVGDPGAKGAKVDDKVIVDLIHFPTQIHPGEGVITRILGPRGTPQVDTLSIIHEFQLPEEFPEAALDVAHRQAAAWEEVIPPDRVDLTRETIVTIDPATARDFDDAISLQHDRDGTWKLGVHIADVAHFVPVGSALDSEAKNRGTSVYLPDRVIPMIPELISNSLASLQEGKIRLTRTAWITFDAQGLPQHVELANTVIRVTKRFAYEQVMPIIRNPDDFRTQVSAKVRKLLVEMHELAMILRKRRFQNGALSMSMPEVEVVFDDQGHVVGAREEHHDESHEIIEEFMLAANIAVATELSRRGIPFLRRNHAPPDEKKLAALAEYVGSVGIQIKGEIGRRQMQKILDAVLGTDLEHPVSFTLLRSMKQADYSPEPIGHFALNEANYCHFTSPIRRYPDLTIHRLVDGLIKSQRGRGPSADELVVLGQHCSDTERRAEKAERELIKLKLLGHYSRRLGEEMECRITGVERFGFFAEGVEVPLEGMVHVSTLPNDHYDYDGRWHTLTGRRANQTFRLGDRVSLVIHSVDMIQRKLEFRLNVSKNRKASNSGKSAFERRPSSPGEARRSRNSRKSDQKKKGKRRG